MARLIILLILATILCSCGPAGPKEWTCDNDFDGKPAKTKVDTYVHPNLDHRAHDHFVGGGHDIIIHDHCSKGSSERFQVTGVSDRGSFSGWVDGADLNIE